MTAAINFLLDFLLIVGLISAIFIVATLAAAFIAFCISQMRNL